MNNIILELSTNQDKEDEKPIKLNKLVRTVLKLFDLYDGLVLDKYKSNTCKQIFWKVLTILFPICCIINVTEQLGLLGFKYALISVSPFNIMTSYLLFSFYPKWIRSQRLKTMLKNPDIVKTFNKHMYHNVLFLIIMLPLLIYILIILPDDFRYSDNTFIQIIKQLTVILVIPYTIIFSLLINLSIGTISCTFNYVCDNIKTYLETLHKTIEDNKESKENIIPLIQDKQEQIESLSLDINDLVGSPIGLIIIIGLFIIFTNIYGIFSDINNGNDIILYVAIPSIIMYGTGVDYLLYCCTRWNTTFELNTYKWKNKADLIPCIVRDFGDLSSFHTWLDNHECHTVRLFGKRGIKINYDVYIKVLSLVGTVFGYLVSMIMDKIK